MKGEEAYTVNGQEKENGGGLVMQENVEYVSPAVETDDKEKHKTETEIEVATSVLHSGRSSALSAPGKAHVKGAQGSSYKVQVSN